ncbi:MAG: hypothetical protein H7222_04555 [Methylotenera sp.]|nr:hypothetical protein [Oligoflexia bacterium]
MNTAGVDYSIAGKVFILGEYAVLRGLPALVAATSPRFALRSAARNGSVVGKTNHTEYAPASPAGRFLHWACKNPSDIPFEFIDPLLGAGGFGASTAQFALLVELELGQVGWKRAWELYRKLMTPSESPVSADAAGAAGIPPSGADLVAQWQGGVQLFDPTKATTEDLTQALSWSDFLIFSATGIAGRKVATHEHLAKLQNFSTESLEKPLFDGIAAIRAGDRARLGQCLGQYADALHELGFENPSAHEDRKILGKISGVLGIKGAGAMQSDSMILLCEKSADRSKIMSAAESRGLRLISEHCFPAQGIQCVRPE